MWESPTGDRVIWHILLSKKLREMFNHLHSSTAAGHFGVTKTQSSATVFLLGQMSAGHSQLVPKLRFMCLKEGSLQDSKSPMHQYNAGVPTERIVLDILGPLPLSEEGNKYILVVSNYFTKWPEAYSLANQEATVAEVLVKEFVSRFRVPRDLH